MSFRKMTNREIREQKERLQLLRDEAMQLAERAATQKEMDPYDYIWETVRNWATNDFESSYIGEHACDYCEKILK